MWLMAYRIRQGLSVFLTGVIVKTMDDSLDYDIDHIAGKAVNPILSNPGILPYTLLIFSVACTLDGQTGGSLFFASFIIGMAGDFDTLMPSGLKGYQESLALIFIGFFIFQSKIFLSSLLAILSFQLLDDILDDKTERGYSQNWCSVLGKVEAVILSLIFFLATLLIDPYKYFMVIFSYFMINFTLNYIRPSRAKSGE